MEEERLLRNVRDLAAQTDLLDLRDVLPVDLERAALDVGEAQQQLGQSGLARAGTPDDSDALTCGNVE